MFVAFYNLIVIEGEFKADYSTKETRNRGLEREPKYIKNVTLSFRNTADRW